MPHERNAKSAKLANERSGLAAFVVAFAFCLAC